MEKRSPGKYFQYTWGCQMNEADSGVAARLLQAAGYEPAVGPDEADLIILNTCSVREKPEQKAYSRIGELRRLKEKRPELTIVVAGCMAQRQGEQILRRMPHVDVVLGPRRLDRLPFLIDEARATGHPVVDVSLGQQPMPSWDDHLDSVGAKVESARYNPYGAYVTVMQGCSYFCAYCIVPHVRGPAGSHPPQRIVEEVKRLANDGCKEVMLLGQNILAYGKDKGGRSQLPDLLQAIHDIDELERIRFATGHPGDVDDRLVEAMARLPKVCRHLHAPMQAGHDRLLREMKRGYTVAQYKEMAARIRQALPGVSITSDMIVGFPGETEEEFEASLEAYSQIRFDQAFMFAFSPRPGTPAAQMPGQLPSQVKSQRLQRLIQLQNGITEDINRSFERKTVEVLVEGPAEKDGGRLCGRTTCHRLVVFSGPENLCGQTLAVTISSGHLWGLDGEAVG